MIRMSQIRKEFITSYLRTQIHMLQGLIEDIENNDARGDDGYAPSFKQLEVNIRQVKKLCSDN